MAVIGCVDVVYVYANPKRTSFVARLAQWIAYQTSNLGVAGSSPASRTLFNGKLSSFSRPDKHRDIRLDTLRRLVKLRVIEI